MHYSRLRSLGIAVLAASAVLALAPARSSAQLTLTFANPTQTGIRGSTLSFVGTLTNTSTVTQYLNSDSFTQPGTGLTLDDLPFFANTPLFLNSGQTFTGELFTVAVAANAPAQSATGIFSIVGGTNDRSQNTIASQTFRINVAPVSTNAPEPGSASLLLLGGLAFAPAVRRARRRQNA